MKICVFNPRSEFPKKEQQRLLNLGQVVYTQSRDKLPLKKLLKLSTNSDILAIDPANLGGFEKAKKNLNSLIDNLPRLKGIALDTTIADWIDLDNCKKRSIAVTLIPKKIYRETIAEHTIALLLSAAKRILITDRRTQKNKYRLEEGFELKGKTLGIVGFGNIGSRVAELAKCIGMRVIINNRSAKKITGFEQTSLTNLLAESDLISLHITYEKQNHNLIGRNELKKMKNGVIIINLADRVLVDEKAMVDALLNKQVDTYIYEGEDFIYTPLANMEYAIGLQGFGWYTREALIFAFRIWVDNIISIVKGKPQNRVV